MQFPHHLKAKPVVQASAFLRRLQVYWNFGVARELDDVLHERGTSSHALMGRVDTELTDHCGG